MRIQRFSMAGLLLLWLGSLGCGDAKIDRISSGGNILSGELGGYRWGVMRKRALLQREAEGPRPL